MMKPASLCISHHEPESRPRRKAKALAIPFALVGVFVTLAISIAGGLVRYGELKSQQAADHEAINKLEPMVRQTREDVAEIKGIVQRYRPDRVASGK